MRYVAILLGALLLAAQAAAPALETRRCEVTRARLAVMEQHSDLFPVEERQAELTAIRRNCQSEEEKARQREQCRSRGGSWLERSVTCFYPTAQRRD